MLGSATAPVWNALRPDESTDFIYANDRLIFVGGPIMTSFAAAYPITSPPMITAAFTPSRHTIFVDREDEKGEMNEGYEHEFVHDKQIEKSFFWEHTGESYQGFKEWNTQDAHQYLNL